MITKIRNTALLMLFSIGTFARRKVGDIGKVDDTLKKADSSVNNIINTIINWCYGLLVLGVIVGGLVILFSSGRGEDKIMKFGNLLFVIIAIALLVFIADMLFT